MNRYRNDPTAIRALVRPGDVHRDVYTDPELFELEMERLWHNAVWVYVGHDSQVPAPGTTTATEIAGRPLLMIRSQDGAVRVFYNRCAHRGARLVSATTGQLRRHPSMSVSRVDLSARRDVAHRAAQGGICRHGFRRIAGGPGAGRGRRRRRASRLRLRSVELRGAVVQRLFRRLPVLDRQPGGSFAGRAPRGRRRDVALPARLQLENVHREPERHHASDGRP